ncbi:MAG: glycosyltransferase [Planctomycetes bacterium]|nr:glycosyltransferase [Planctomycetota bacterium]
MIFSSVMNFIFSVWIGRVLDFEALGLVIFINIVWYIAMIFIASFGTTINHKSASLAGANKVDLSDAYRSAIILKGLRVILPLALIWILAAPYLSDFFRISDYLVLLLVAPIFPFGLIIYANVGFLEGVLRFRAAALILTAEAALKLAITGALISAGRAELAYAAIPGSVVAACLFSLLFMRRRISPRPAPLKFSFPWKFFTSSVLANLSAISFLSFDIVLAKHFLAPAVAGEYTLLSLVGKMVYFGGSLPNLFMVTYASRWQSLGRDPGEVLRKIFLATAALLAGGVVVIGVFGHVTAALIFGDKVEAVAAHLPLYTFGIALFTLTNVIVTYQLARKNYNYPVIALSFSILLAVGVFFRHADIADFVNIITITGALSFLTIGGWHLLSGWQAVIRRNFKDLAGLFTGRIPISAALAGNKKRILIFNWRDMRHVYAGGAEMYVHKISEYWVGQGNQVTIFCGNDGFSRRNETINGVNVIRRGGFYFVYIWAALYYFIYFRGRFDLIIDCQNGIPFFTPLYAREPVYCLMHHVHQEIFRRSLAKPLAALAIFLEKVMMPWAYRQVKFITVSESSQREIAQLGLGQAGISVVNPGVDLDFLKPGEKSPFPLVLYFGRLNEYKSINVLIKAFKLIVARIPGAKLVIAGSGEESDNLRELAAVLQLEADVIFTGRVTDEEKKNWLQQAWVAVNPSFMEGWGITTIEANACGTPVVASNVPGLKDSVQNPHTGILVEYGNVAAFADRIADILEDHAFRKKLSASAADWAKNFDWESRSRIFLEYIENDYRAQGYKNII